MICSLSADDRSKEDRSSTKEDAEDVSGEESKSVGLEKEDALNQAR